MKRIVLVGLLCLGSCGPSRNEADEKAIADLERRVVALERAAPDRAPAQPAQGYELVAPGLGGERRFYATEAKCYEARTQLLNEGASRAAAMRGGHPYGRFMVDTPFVSCIPV